MSLENCDPDFKDMPKDVKNSLLELKEIFKSSIEYIDGIEFFNGDLDSNLDNLINDFSDLNGHYQFEAIPRIMKNLKDFKDRLNDPENIHPEINPNDKFWTCSECNNKITENTCNEYLKSMCVNCINSMTSG